MGQKGIGLRNPEGCWGCALGCCDQGTGAEVPGPCAGRDATDTCSGEVGIGLKNKWT